MNLNTQFVFEGKLKRNLIIGMVLGAICLAWSLVGDDEYHTRFWTNWLHNSVFFTGVAFMAMFFLSAQITAFAGWISAVRRVWEAMSQFMWVGLILLGVVALGVWAHFHHLYHWNDPNLNITDPEGAHFDRIIAGKRAFLNPGFFTFAVLGVLGIWYFWAYKLRRLSVAQDTLESASFDYYKQQRKWAASFLPLGGFLSTIFLWQTVMSVDPHWYSTMFAWYSMISVWLGGQSLTILLIIYLKSRGHLEFVTREHLHDLGKYLFGISVFWAYLWFDQFMLIWYANNGEETIYFKERMDHYPVLFWGNLLMNFVAPFLILMRNDTKRKFGTMFFVALIVFLGHWWDFFYMIKPGARIAAFEAKELAEAKQNPQKAAPLSAVEPEEDAAPAKEIAAPADAHAASEGTASAPHDSASAPGGDGHGAESPAASESHPTEQAAAAAAAAPHGEDAAEGGHGDEHGAAAHHGPDKSFQLGYSVPGIQEIGILIGFLSLFLYFFFSQLARVSLIPSRDPYLEESLHHSTGAYISGESGLGDDAPQGGHGH